MQAADDPQRHRPAERKRNADGDDEIADLQLTGIAERQRGQILHLHLEHGHVGIRIGADQHGFHPAAADQRHGDATGMLDDVIVGDDQALGRIEDHAGAGPGFLMLVCGLGRASRLGGRNLRIGALGLDHDGDDRRRCLPENRSERRQPARRVDDRQRHLGPGRDQATDRPRETQGKHAEHPMHGLDPSSSRSPGSLPRPASPSAYDPTWPRSGPGRVPTDRLIQDAAAGSVPDRAASFVPAARSLLRRQRAEI